MIVLSIGACAGVSDSGSLESATATAGAPQPGTTEEAQGTTSPSAFPEFEFVERDIHDRPGVPPSLKHVYWAAFGQVGEIGTTARVVLPESEFILAAGSGLIVSYRVDPLDLSPIVGPAGTELIVRELLTGRLVGQFGSQVSVESGVLVGSMLFWGGSALESADTGAVDGGLWVLDLGDPGATPKLIPGTLEAAQALGSDAVRGGLHLTDHGAALTSVLSSPKRLATQIVDIAAVSIRTTIDDYFVLDVVGDLALTAVPHEFTSSENPGSLRVIGLADGNQVGESIPATLVKASVVGTQEVFVQLGRGRDSHVVGIDLTTGRTRDLRLVKDGQETWDLSREMSAPDQLVFTPVSGPELDEAGNVRLPLGLLDAETGEFTSSAIVVENK